MFLTPPTLEELKESDLTDLIDMLSIQTIEHSRLIKTEGVGFKSMAVKKMIYNIQAAIEEKMTAGNSTIPR